MLVTVPDFPSTPNFASTPLSGWPGDWTVRWVAETGSTNADLVAAGAAGAPHRSVLFADFQRAGRGRLDRGWDAPVGANLLASLLLRELPTHPHEITQRIALAALVASRTLTGLEPTLKWPNDLLLDGAKLAGVLAQMGAWAEGPFVVVGIGLNVGWAPPGAARLGDGVTPRDVLRELLVAFDALPDDVTSMYHEHLGTLGQMVRVELPGEQMIVGRAIDVEPDGRLVVLDECAISHRIDTGDVVHLRLAE
ncbi:MAG TPA: biotin--[acetyl-CoA-carboxylase] ligase [Ilumatobacteraceae bacterium]